MIAPSGFILDWLLFDKHGHMKLRHIFLWVASPLLYALASLFVSAKTGGSIYPFFNMQPGKPELFTGLGVMVCALTATAFAIVGIDRLLGPKQNT